MTKVMTGSYSSCICAQCKGTKNTRGKKNHIVLMSVH